LLLLLSLVFVAVFSSSDGLLLSILLIINASKGLRSLWSLLVLVVDVFVVVVDTFDIFGKVTEEDNLLTAKTPLFPISYLGSNLPERHNV